MEPSLTKFGRFKNIYTRFILVEKVYAGTCPFPSPSAFLFLQSLKAVFSCAKHKCTVSPCVDMIPLISCKLFLFDAVIGVTALARLDTIVAVFGVLGDTLGRFEIGDCFGVPCRFVFFEALGDCLAFLGFGVRVERRTPPLEYFALSADSGSASFTNFLGPSIHFDSSLLVLGISSISPSNLLRCSSYPSIFLFHPASLFPSS
mmetsp:Transcript_7856/g.8657  ORF Transcript_7856/g.8657 Transcript_7856/m.8657 type:complete len:203 (-) Transcript_7856:176-784(-)